MTLLEGINFENGSKNNRHIDNQRQRRRIEKQILIILKRYGIKNIF